ncbi:VWA domain-containing protein [uncultured Dechloromonas sp.]|uniref:VWA domain-containing protein n=1 Tax=uncultured Dechloromonas sp. TaxID=171719 RepID=UPI0025E31F97|nr:VWA domain-containing protein [uncultured Dechloromonas sp.]
MMDSLWHPWVWPVGKAALSLSWPAVLLLAPLPWVLWRFRRPHRSRFEALHAPFFAALAEETGTPTHTDGTVLPLSVPGALILLLCWVALLLAATRPVWIEEPLTRSIPRRDLLLVLDISQSMATRDVAAPGGRPVERIEAARGAIDEFIRSREGDRLGLAVFGNGAYLLAPFTEDHALVRELLAEVRPGLAGPRTQVGDAIGLGIKLFEASTAPSRVMVLLTDGTDTGSRVPPETAARVARERGVVVHTVALGKPDNPVDKVDTATLQAIARITGGRSALAGRSEELKAVYRQLDALEQKNHETLTHRPQRELFHWPLGAMTLLLFVWQFGAALWASWHTRAKWHA